MNVERTLQSLKTSCETLIWICSALRQHDLRQATRILAEGPGGGTRIDRGSDRPSAAELSQSGALCFRQATIASRSTISTERICSRWGGSRRPRSGLAGAHTRSLLLVSHTLYSKHQCKSRGKTEEAHSSYSQYLTLLRLTWCPALGHHFQSASHDSFCPSGFRSDGILPVRPYIQAKYT